MHLYSRRRIIYPMPTGRTPGALYRATPSQDGCILARHYVQWASPSSICSTRRIYRCTITWDLLHPILLIRQNLQYVSPPPQHLIQKCKGGPHPVFLHITQRFSKWGLQRLFTEVVDPSHVVPPIPILQSWYMHHSFYAPPPSLLNCVYLYHLYYFSIQQCVVSGQHITVIMWCCRPALSRSSFSTLSLHCIVV